MFRRTAVVFAALSAVLAGLSAPAQAATASDGAGATGCRRELDRAVERYVATTDRRDASAFVGLLADDYIAILPGGATLIGKAAGAKFIDTFFARTDWTQTFSLVSTSVQRCSTATTVFASTYTDEDGAVPLVIGLVWTRERGRWLVLFDQNTVVG